MRSARAEDAWRRATERDRAFRLRRLRAIGKPPLVDLDEELTNGLTLICGLNGAGKTTLLRLLEAAITARDLTNRCRPDVLSEGDLLVTVELDGASFDLAVGAARDVRAPTTVLIDAFSFCERLYRVALQSHFDDLLVGVEPRELTPQELLTAAYVVGKTYDSLQVYEIEDPDDEEAVLPVLVARSGPLTYDFRTMGLGELAALVSLWQITRAEAATVLLLEEPETFLSSRSTVALLDVLAERINDKRLYAVVTTHSMEAAARVPIESVRVLISTSDGVTLRRPSTRGELEHMLGAFIGMPRVVLVEDGMAGEVVAELLGRYSGIWGESVEVVAAGGAPAVTAAITHFPSTSAVRAVGVLDGDQAAPAAELPWPVLVLPGDAAPETLVRTAADANRELFADRVGRTTQHVDAALGAAVGLDHHDWPGAIAVALSVDARTVIRAGLHCWLAIGDNERAGRDFVDQLSQALTEPGSDRHL